MMTDHPSSSSAPGDIFVTTRWTVVLAAGQRSTPLADRALVLFAWSASKAFSAYGVRVGALVAATADGAQRSAARNALTFACRATWSNCGSAGQIAIARCR